VSLRIVHVVDYLMPRMGYQEYLLAKWNAKHGHEVHVVTSDRYAPVPNYDETLRTLLGERVVGPTVERADGFTVHRLPTALEWRTRTWIVGLTEAIERIRPDVVFCHGSTSVTAFRVARFAGKHQVPLLMDNHMVFSVMDRTEAGRVFYRVLPGLTRRFLSPVTYRFLGVADECCAFLRDVQGVSPSQVELLPLGLDLDVFSVDGKSGLRARAGLGIPRDARVVLQTGKLTRDKGAALLSAAIAPTMKRDTSVWLVFVGSGPEDYVDEVLGPVREAGVTDRVRFVPLMPLAELPSAYRLADLCVYPAASSLSCVEAAGCGRAVVMSDLPIGRWRAERGVGVCYQTGDVDNLRRTIEELLANDAERCRLGKSAAEAVRHSFSYDVIARDSEAMMRNAISARRAAPEVGRDRR